MKHDDFLEDLDLIENYATAILDLIADARAAHDVPTREVARAC